MSNRYSKYQSPLAFIDMLFNMLVVFVFLFTIALLQIKKNDDHPGVEMKAEFMITMTWPEDTLDDIDLWLLLPDEKPCGFMFREVEYVTLDRDDTGGSSSTNIVYDPGGGYKWIKSSREFMLIRSLQPGKYVVNVFVYRVIDEVLGFKSTTKLPYPVKVRLTKLNPRATDAVTQTVTVERLGQEKTAFTFRIDNQGNIVDVNTEEEHPFVPLGEVRKSRTNDSALGVEMP